VIKNPATRIATTIVLVGGLAVAAVPDRAASDGQSGDTIDPLQVPAPEFQLRWQRGELSLSGNTSSPGHEQALLALANSSLPGATVRADFQALGVVPPHWQDSTLLVLQLLVATVSAQADLTADRLWVRAVTLDELAWERRLDALKKQLPRHVSINADALVADPCFSVEKACEREFTSFAAGPINFEESSTEFRNSAFPRLDRVVVLANACSDSMITITGHTDSSGNTSSNQRLSLQRAKAVGDYIVAGGVDRARLRVSGAGSTAPVADNRTRYGRSLNRRIEIVLSNPDPAAN